MSSRLRRRNLYESGSRVDIRPTARHSHSHNAAAVADRRRGASEKDSRTLLADVAARSSAAVGNTAAERVAEH